MRKFKRKMVATFMAASMVLSFGACGKSEDKETTTAKQDEPKVTEAAKPDATEAPGTETQTTEAKPADSGKLIKVGIINNDPNESGYRTANDLLPDGRRRNHSRFSLRPECPAREHPDLRQ